MNSKILNCYRKRLDLVFGLHFQCKLFKLDSNTVIMLVIMFVSSKRYTANQALKHPWIQQQGASQQREVRQREARQVDSVHGYAVEGHFVEGHFVQGHSVQEDHVQGDAVHKSPLTDHFLVEKTILDSGACGKIVTVWHKETKHERVAKIQQIANEDDLNFILKEIRVHSIVNNHPHVVKIFEAYQEEKSIAIIMEKINGKNLYDHAKNTKQLPLESTVIRWTSQLLQAFSFMHEKHIAHLDVKPENILLLDNDCGGEVKICDFGCAQVVGRNGVYISNPQGTALYNSPEMVDCTTTRVCVKSDIFSLGLVVHFVLSHKDLFDKDESFSREEVFHRIKHQVIHFDTSLNIRSTAALDFMTKLIERNRW